MMSDVHAGGPGSPAAQPEDLRLDELLGLLRRIEHRQEEEERLLARDFADADPEGARDRAINRLAKESARDLGRIVSAPGYVRLLTWCMAEFGDDGDGVPSSAIIGRLIGRLARQAPRALADVRHLRLEEALDRLEQPTMDARGGPSGLPQPLSREADVSPTDLSEEHPAGPRDSSPAQSPTAEALAMPSDPPGASATRVGPAPFDPLNPDRARTLYLRARPRAVVLNGEEIAITNPRLFRVFRDLVEAGGIAIPARKFGGGRWDRLLRRLDERLYRLIGRSRGAGGGYFILEPSGDKAIIE